MEREAVGDMCAAADRYPTVNLRFVPWVAGKVKETDGIDFDAFEGGGCDSVVLVGETSRFFVVGVRSWVRRDCSYK